MSREAAIKKLEEALLRIKQLERENKELRKQLAVVNQSWYSGREKKEKVSDGKEPEERKKAGVVKANVNRGAKKGHEGYHRKLQEADQHIHFKLHQCPECGSKVGKQSEKYTRQVLELIQLPMIQTHEYHFYQAHCSNCQKTVSTNQSLIPELGKYEYTGPKLRVLISLLRFKLNQSVDQIHQMINFLATFEFKRELLSRGEIAEIYQEVQDYGETAYQGILDEIRAGPYAHWDETGLSCAGERGYVWTGRNQDHCYYQVELTRGSKVIEKAMPDYPGILIVDYFSSYKSDKYTIQRCWVHLLREINKLKEHNPHNKPIRYLHEALHDIYIECQNPDPKSENSFKVGIRNLIAKHRRYKKNAHAGALRIINRLEKHIDELFVFLRHKGVPAHNNPVENSIRSITRYRDNSFCVQSERGMKSLAVGKTLIETCKLKNQNEFNFLLNLISTTH